MFLDYLNLFYKKIFKKFKEIMVCIFNFKYEFWSLQDKWHKYYLPSYMRYQLW